MSIKRVASGALNCLRIGLATVALFQFTIGASLANAAPQPKPHTRDNDTTSPIKHLIVIIGENRSFDHVFATYVPKDGQFVWNLLSEKIINADGTPGVNFYNVAQTAADATKSDAFLLSPSKVPFAGGILPAPLVGGPELLPGYTPSVSYVPNECDAPTPETACAQSLAGATASENGLLPNDIPLLLSGGSTAKHKTPDTRIANVTSLPPGPFQLTGPTFSYDDYSASPVHRFYQMWQELDCSLEHADFLFNPSGCDARLFPWVEVTVGAGTNGDTQPPLCSSDGDVTPCFTYNYLPSVPKAKTTGEGSTAMAFYNVQQGDAPYFKSLADDFAISDNFHQSVDGGTGANHIMFGHGDAIFFYDPNSNTPWVPPNGATVDTTNPSEAGVVNEVENPNPASGTNNWYSEDGYGEGGYGDGNNNTTPPPTFLNENVYGGGSYSDCSDPSQPGVGPIVSYLQSIHIDPRCEPGHYYLLNNYNPGYFGQGENAYTDTSEYNTPFTIPPSSTPSIGDDLSANNISWKYYGDQWNDYAGNAKLGIPEDKYDLNYGPVGSLNVATNAPIVYADEYCNICNPFQYDTSTMANEAVRKAHIQDTVDLYDDIRNGKLPAVSIVKPSGLVDGHPASSKLDLFEGFTKKIVDMVRKSQYWQNTAIFITEDEGGGYYDSGYVQPLDFFGDGTRIIFLVVSPYATGGHISHDYADHVSILKFIERNWNIGPVTQRSRDNFPNPKTLPFSPYVPINSPALSDLFDLFDFGRDHH
ncbi:MAG TPA: alkaline phosphatase family protein [Candidatus Acidoferrales bacterium]|nr:alkaline phosphatase family protein [Candidatus Acidoferrales bacterium]